jgi:hypothetical protein
MIAVLAQPGKYDGAVPGVRESAENNRDTGTSLF